MKKFLAILIALATVLSLCFSLVSCDIIKEDAIEEECDHVDKNNDNKCDDCDEKVKGIHKHKDKDKDSVCDDCYEVLEYNKNDPSDDCDEHVDEDKDYKCDECGEELKKLEAPDLPITEDEWRSVFVFDNVTIDKVEYTTFDNRDYISIRYVDEKVFYSVDDEWFYAGKRFDEILIMFDFSDRYAEFEFINNAYVANDVILEIGVVRINCSYIKINFKQDKIENIYYEAFFVEDDKQMITAYNFYFSNYGVTVAPENYSSVSGDTDEPGDNETSEDPINPSTPTATVTKSEWADAFNVQNAKFSITEQVYYSGQLYQSYTTDYYAVDDLVYDKDALEIAPVSDLLEYYLMFGDSFDSFKLDTLSRAYKCKTVTVDGYDYSSIIATFNEEKQLTYLYFEVADYYYTYAVSISISGHGTTEKPVRAPFEAEGEEYCEYFTNRDVEGHKLAYITMTIKGYGEVKLLLDATTAPETVLHILKLINEGFYDGLTFHRVIDEFMIQGGDPNADGSGDYKDANGNKVTIKGEFSSNGHENDIKHIRGVISMARASDKNSASCQFFICNATADWLDGEYAAFGYVIDGMSVIDHLTYDTFIYGDLNGSISDKTKQAVIESIVIDELVGITLDNPFSENEWKELFKYENVTWEYEMTEKDGGETVNRTFLFVDGKVYVSFDGISWPDVTDMRDGIIAEIDYSDYYADFEYYGEEDSYRFFHADEIILDELEDGEFYAKTTWKSIDLVTDTYGNILAIYFVLEEEIYSNGELMQSYTVEVSSTFFHHGSTEAP